MKIRAKECQPPANSHIAMLVPGSYFYDAWSIPAAVPALDPLGQFLRVARSTPAWIDALMRLRNQVVRHLGLKNLGAMTEIQSSKDANEYKPGDRVGIFTLISKTDSEVLLGDSDKHLDVVVSVYRQPSEFDATAVVTVTTVVKVHNWLGRLYMLPVRPAHRRIVQVMTRAVGTAPR